MGPVERVSPDVQPIGFLEKMTKEELLAQWRRLPGKHPPPTRLDRLIRELAYRLQEQRQGPLDKNTRVSLARHMAAFEKSLLTKKPETPAKTPAKILLERNSVLTRQWNDRTITVHVMGAREFLFEERRFKSLSSIARQVTGQHLSGPLFFGLKEVARG